MAIVRWLVRLFRSRVIYGITPRRSFFLSSSKLDFVHIVAIAPETLSEPEVDPAKGSGYGLSAYPKLPTS
jgi:hypothetical protein